MRIQDIGAALLVAIIWGVNFSAIEIGLQELPPILFSALRFAVVGIPAVVFVPFPKTAWLSVLAVGLFLGVFKFTLLFIAMRSDAGAGVASLLLQVQVFFTIGLSVLIFNERLQAPHVIGLVLVASGLGCFIFSAGTNVTLLGLALIILAALCWSIANLVLKRLSTINLLHFMIWVSVIPPIPLAVLSYYLESQSPIALLLSSSVATWIALAYVGYLSTLVGFALWGKLLNRYPAAQVTPFALLVPVVGIGTANFLFAEQLSGLEAIGAILILCALGCCVFANNLVNFWREKNRALFYR